MFAKLRLAYDRHHAFLLIFGLFVSFRLLALILFRPGGFIADASDYDFYLTWGESAPMGYRTFENLWTAYPPLFPALLLPIHEFSSRIPPWVDPRLFFHLIFGLALLLFESGNVILIYRLAQKLGIGDWRLEIRDSESSPISNLQSPISLHPVILYALLFTPVYTLIGWFEAMPLFFMLLGLDLLLSTRRWGWIGSAIAAGLGFLTKLTPALLVPIGVRWLGGKLSWSAVRHEWFNRKSPGNLLRPTLYAGIFLATVVGLGYWLMDGNTHLALSSFRVNSLRPPWQSVWALLEGNYDYGRVPIDMRNLVGLESGGQWTGWLPWTWISLGFSLLYLWLYTRRYDWEQPRTPVAFAAVSVVWLFLYSKGWSPQFLVWILAFLVLLLPTVRGMAYAIMLSLINVVESNIFIILLPDEHWIMVGTVVVRTVLLILLLCEFLGQIWPTPLVGQQMRRVSAGLAWGVMLLALIGAGFGAPRVAQAYQARRLAEHPCRAALDYLRAQSEWPNQMLVSDQIEVWRNFYPWLRDEYEMKIIDGYDPYDRPWATMIAERLDAVVQDREFWWIVQTETPSHAQEYFAQPNVHIIDQQQLGACQIARVVRLNEAPLAVADAAGGSIQLLHYETERPQVGAPLHLVLYWRADRKVTASYTVFTQLLDPAGQLVAQQDNLPVEGLAPTDTWQPDRLIRDPYRLTLPPNASPGLYELLVGFYDADGRRTLTLPDGTTADHLSLPIEVAGRDDKEGDR